MTVTPSVVGAPAGSLRYGSDYYGCSSDLSHYREPETGTAAPIFHSNERSLRGPLWAGHYRRHGLARKHDAGRSRKFQMLADWQAPSGLVTDQLATARPRSITVS